MLSLLKSVFAWLSSCIPWTDPVAEKRFMLYYGSRVIVYDIVACVLGVLIEFVLLPKPYIYSWSIFMGSRALAGQMAWVVHVSAWFAMFAVHLLTYHLLGKEQYLQHARGWLYIMHRTAFVCGVAFNLPPSDCCSSPGLLQRLILLPSLASMFARVTVSQYIAGSAASLLVAGAVFSARCPKDLISSSSSMVYLLDVVLPGLFLAFWERQARVAWAKQQQQHLQRQQQQLQQQHTTTAGAAGRSLRQLPAVDTVPTTAHSGSSPVMKRDRSLIYESPLLFRTVAVKIKSDLGAQPGDLQLIRLASTVQQAAQGLDILEQTSMGHAVCVPGCTLFLGSITGLWVTDGTLHQQQQQQQLSLPAYAHNTWHIRIRSSNIQADGDLHSTGTLQGPGYLVVETYNAFRAAVDNGTLQSIIALSVQPHQPSPLPQLCPESCAVGEWGGSCRLHLQQQQHDVTNGSSSSRLEARIFVVQGNSAVVDQSMWLDPVGSAAGGWTLQLQLPADAAHHTRHSTGTSHSTSSSHIDGVQPGVCTVYVLATPNSAAATNLASPLAAITVLILPPGAASELSAWLDQQQYSQQEVAPLLLDMAVAIGAVDQHEQWQLGAIAAKHAQEFLHTSGLLCCAALMVAVHHQLAAAADNVDELTVKPGQSAGSSQEHVQPHIQQQQQQHSLGFAVRGALIGWWGPNRHLEEHYMTHYAPSLVQYFLMALYTVGYGVFAFRNFSMAAARSTPDNARPSLIISGIGQASMASGPGRLLLLPPPTRRGHCVWVLVTSLFPPIIYLLWYVTPVGFNESVQWAIVAANSSGMDPNMITIWTIVLLLLMHQLPPPWLYLHLLATVWLVLPNIMGGWPNWFWGLEADCRDQGGGLAPQTCNAQPQQEGHVHPTSYNPVTFSMAGVIVKLPGWAVLLASIVIGVAVVVWLEVQNRARFLARARATRN